MGGEAVNTVYGPISDTFEHSLLGDLCLPDGGVQTGPFGSQLHASDYVEHGIPIITVEHLGDNRIVHENVPCVSDEDAHRLSKYVLKTGDIVFSRVGSVDRRAIVHPGEEGWLFSGRCLRVRPDPTKIDAAYLSWFLGLPGFKYYVRQIAVGATMPSLNTTLLSDMPIYFPPALKEQQAIACILGTLDDKIELNRRMNETLEAMARAIFKSWFVDFDPVRAKAEGRNRGLPDHIAALFPDQLEESDIGEIPRGWPLTQLGAKANTVKGRSYRSSELVDSSTALVTLKSFARGGGYRPDGLKSYAGNYNPDQVVEPGELVIACTDVTQAAQVVGRPAIVRPSRHFGTLVASLDTLIVRPIAPDITRAFLYFLAGTNAFAWHMYAHTTGTTVLHLAKEAVPSFRFPQPTEHLVKAFDDVASPLLDRIAAAETESEVMAALRDTLLPKLISGELRVPDAERIVGRCV
jgi:type I restriction enzyme S subunit